MGRKIERLIAGSLGKRLDWRLQFATQFINRYEGRPWENWQQHKLVAYHGFVWCVMTSCMRRVCCSALQRVLASQSSRHQSVMPSLQERVWSTVGPVLRVLTGTWANNRRKAKITSRLTFVILCEKKWSQRWESENLRGEHGNIYWHTTQSMHIK